MCVHFMKIHQTIHYNLYTFMHVNILHYKFFKGLVFLGKVSKDTENSVLSSHFSNSVCIPQALGSNLSCHRAFAQAVFSAFPFPVASC